MVWRTLERCVWVTQGLGGSSSLEEYLAGEAYYSVLPELHKHYLLLAQSRHDLPESLRHRFTKCLGTCNLCDHFFMYVHTRRLLNGRNDKRINHLLTIYWRIVATCGQQGNGRGSYSTWDRRSLLVTPPILCDDALLFQANKSPYPLRSYSRYVVSIVATSIQDYRTIELLFRASSSSGLGANASLAS